MKIVCVTVVNETNPRRTETVAHFAERGLQADFFQGIHASKLGIETTLTYEVDNPGTGYKTGVNAVGCWLTHRAVWASLLMTEGPDSISLILEDDARMPTDWRVRVDAAIRQAPVDWDMIFVGSCCTTGKPKIHVAGSVYEVKWPFCTHAYLVRGKALRPLIETQDAARLYAPIDISLTFHSFPSLKVYTVLPRIFDQHATVLSE